MGGMSDEAKLPDGWSPCSGPEGFVEELNRELVKGHPLFGRKLTVLAVRQDRDDALFRAASGEMFVVHLTWIQKPERLPWPIVVWESARHDFDEFKAWSAEFYDHAR